MQYVPCNSALLAQEMLFFTQKNTFFCPKYSEKSVRGRALHILCNQFWSKPIGETWPSTWRMKKENSWHYYLAKRGGRGSNLPFFRIGFSYEKKNIFKSSETTKTLHLVFIGPRSDHSLPMSVTHWLTHWRPFWIDVTTLLKMEWIDPFWWNQISKQCWCWNEVEGELATAYNSCQSWQQWIDSQWWNQIFKQCLCGNEVEV